MSYSEEVKGKSEWNIYNLDEVYNFSSGLSKSSKEFGFGYPFVTFKDVFYNYFIPQELTELANTTEKERIRCSVMRGDVFLTRTSETINELGKSSVAVKDYPEATFNGFTKRLRPNGKIKVYPEYAGYYFRSPKFRSEINSMATMTTRASLNNDMMARLKIVLPSLEDQKAIASILLSLDSKIELNNEMNKTLEEMAQVLFRRWFVDFEFHNEDGEPYKSSGGEMIESELGMIPKGWEIKKIQEIGTVVAGGTPSTKVEEYYDGEIPWITPKDLSGYDRKFISKGERSITQLGLDKSSAKLMKKGTVLFSSRAPIGYIVIAENTVTTNQGFKSIVCNEEIINNNYVYHYLKFNKDKIESVASGSTFKEVSGATMKNLDIILPEKSLLDKFKEVLGSYDNIMRKNYLENDSLIEIRDSLLPKLMSGEIRIE